MWFSFTYRLLALLVAANYFAFRVEMFGEEYEQSHPSGVCGNSLSLPSVNWESFDKDNAPQAISVGARIVIEPLGLSPREPRIECQYYPPFRLILDKSPPMFPLPV